MSMHLDQLTEWWNEATPGIPKTGDTYIEDERHRGRSFRIVEAATDHKCGFENTRILARAPKPKPAWHSAAAIMARTKSSPDAERSVFVRDPDGYWNDAFTGQGYFNIAFLDVIPLIPAEVTDEMVRRGSNWAIDNPMYGDEHVRNILSAALGLENK